MQKIITNLRDGYTYSRKWIFFVALALLLYFSLKNFYTIHDVGIYFQTIFVGFIAFSIPFLWNAYQVILDIKKQSVGDSVKHFLSKYYYQKANKNFEAFLLFPTGIVIFFGLFGSALLPLTLTIYFMIISFVYFVFQPQIFRWIETISSTDFKNFITETDPANDDLRKTFREIWQMDDGKIEQEFSLRIYDLMDIFAQKINILSSDETDEQQK
jgi:hypothetical protein